MDGPMKKTGATNFHITELSPSPPFEKIESVLKNECYVTKNHFVTGPYTVDRVSDGFFSEILRHEDALTKFSNRTVTDTEILIYVHWGEINYIYKMHHTVKKKVYDNKTFSMFIREPKYILSTTFFYYL